MSTTEFTIGISRSSLLALLNSALLVLACGFIEYQFTKAETLCRAGPNTVFVSYYARVSFPWLHFTNNQLDCGFTAAIVQSLGNHRSTNWGEPEQVPIIRMVHRTQCSNDQPTGRKPHLWVAQPSSTAHYHVLMVEWRYVWWKVSRKVSLKIRGCHSYLMIISWKKVTLRWMTKVSAYLREGETRRGEEAEQGRRCKHVAAEIDEYRLEMERTRSRDKGGLWLRVRRLDLRWREQGAKKGGLWLGREVRLEVERTRSQERWTVATRLLVSMSRILLANSAHQAEAVNSQVLPCTRFVSLSGLVSA